MAKKDLFKLAVVSAATALLIACGGGGGGGGEAPAAVEAGTAVGVLTDSPIEGVEYTTSGGYTGLTDANGNYNYNPGETVTFKIGGITLGTVEATGTVTPLELGGGNANKVTNLLVLFQSLDADGDASNGITVTPAARTAAADVSLDFTDAPADFASTGNSALVRLIASADTTNTAPVSPEHALAHFKAQFLKSLRGAWVGTDGDSTVVLRFEEDGHYIMGEVAPTEGEGHTGIEYGLATWNAATGVTTADVGFDGNGDWGLSHLRNDATFRVDGDSLIVREGTETFTFKRLPNTAASAVGAWTLGESSTDILQPTFVFLPARAGATHTTYFMLDPTGPCGSGLEVGRYVVADGHLRVTSNNVDQNGDCGLWNGTEGLEAAISFSADGKTATVTVPEGAETFRRVGR